MKVLQIMNYYALIYVLSPTNFEMAEFHWQVRKHTKSTVSNGMTISDKGTQKTITFIPVPLKGIHSLGLDLMFVLCNSVSMFCTHLSTERLII